MTPTQLSMDNPMMAMMGQMGMMQNPMEQLSGLMQLLAGMQQMAQAPQQMQMQQRELDMRQNAFDAEQSQVPLIEAMRRAQMIASMRASGVPLDHEQANRLFGLAGFGDILDLSQQQTPQAQYSGPPEKATQDTSWLLQDMQRASGGGGW